MKEKDARKYLEEKGKKVTEKELEKVMKEGKIYGDPEVSLSY
jgi:hypothetical protein